ncbi:MAG: hypothetical protein U5J98_03520 [Halobacteriales archaeon]|nr:hypothetical protein [Halobacteriales archaeon]
MSTMRSIKQSNVARFGTYGLVILWYVIFVLGTLLQFGFGAAGLRQQGVQLAIASVVFIALLMIIRWFFESKGG